ncbi:MAG TPA: GGDEF domain-containing protein, partial [Clostridiales bacterium]|nr:GGDEF domain-containing protein [Clostridiales bacterium]
FKSLNDALGHLIGDKCLIEMGNAMTENCEDGFPFRFGGDEFCILFKNRSVDNVVDICARIQKYMNEAAVRILPDRELTVSVGIASHKQKSDIARMVVNADHALYEAKSIKDTIQIYKPEEDEI